MALHLNKLTALQVNKLVEPGYYSDGGGLVLQISKSGSKSWIFRFVFEGRRHEMGLGGLSGIGLAEARIKAKECRGLLQNGQSPLHVRNAGKTAARLRTARQMTFDQCATAYIQSHRRSWKNPKHVSQWENTLATYASPGIGALPVAAIDTELIVKVLMPVWESKTETATRLRGRIECILDWAAVSKFRAGENPARWRGHLENLLADPNKIAPVKNHPALQWQEIPAFVTALIGVEGLAARALLFAILTAARSGEVRGATWSEIDMTDRLWVIDAERMKAGKEHRVPLSDAAMALLNQVPRKGGFIFPGRNPGSVMSDMTLTAVLRRMNRIDITVHGFRSSFRDWCAEAPGNSYPREICEHALAHSLPDRVEAAYRRGDLLEKRIGLMQSWGKYCVPKANL